MESMVEEAELGRLRGRMVRRARRLGVPADEIEDVVQEALLKAIRERERPGAPGLEVRAFTALRDKRAEFARARARRLRLGSPIVAERLSLEGELEAPGSGTELIELWELVREIAGEDAVVFALLKSLGATEEDVARIMEWPRSRAAASRVQLSRRKPLILQAMAEGLEEEESKW